jgi:hypothetical protein
MKIFFVLALLSAAFPGLLWGQVYNPANGAIALQLYL